MNDEQSQNNKKIIDKINDSNQIVMPNEEIEKLFKEYSELKYKLVRSLFSLAKFISVIFSCVSGVHIICSIFGILHCSTIITSNLIYFWAIFITLIYAISLCIIFLFTTNGKEISKALTDTNNLVVSDNSVFGKLFKTFKRLPEENNETHKH